MNKLIVFNAFIILVSYSNIHVSTSTNAVFDFYGCTIVIKSMYHACIVFKQQGGTINESHLHR